MNYYQNIIKKQIIVTNGIATSELYCDFGYSQFKNNDFVVNNISNSKIPNIKNISFDSIENNLLEKATELLISLNEKILSVNMNFSSVLDIERKQIIIEKKQSYQEDERHNGICRIFISSEKSNKIYNFNIDKETLFVKEIVVGEGATMKRWMPRAHGRAFKILKRTCHLKVVLDQQVKETVKVDDKVAAKKDEKKKGLKGSKRKDNVTVKKTAGDNSAAKEKIVKE